MQRTLNRIRPKSPLLTLYIHSFTYANEQDGTLIRVKSGARFAADAGDWTWLYSKVPNKLKELRSEGYVPGKW